MTNKILMGLGAFSVGFLIATVFILATPKTVLPIVTTLPNTSISGVVIDRQANPGTYKISHLTIKEKDRVIEINSEIGPNVFPVINTLKKLDKDNKPIYLLLNSPGGSVLDGAALIAQMQSMKSPVYTVCTELCASMAAIIHQYGTKRYGLDHSILMFHPASAGAVGQVNNMVSRAEFLKTYVNKFNDYIVNRSGLTHEAYDKLIAYELWLDAEDSLSRGFLDGIVSLDADVTGPNMNGSDRLKGIPNTNPNKFFELSN